jgi:DNA-binding LytR/AlgR family response regulator
MKNTKLINRDIPLVHIGSRKIVLAEDIILLQAEINYTNLYLSNGQKIIVSYNLGKLQERLNIHRSFIRPNRNTIVNLNFVTKYNENFLNINGTTVPISRRRKDFVSVYFKKFQNSPVIKN